MVEWDEGTGLPVGACKEDVINALRGLQENIGYQYLIRNIEKRIALVKDIVIRPISDSSAKQGEEGKAKSKDAKTDFHNSNVSKIKTLQDILKMVQDSMHELKR